MAKAKGKRPRKKTRKLADKIAKLKTSLQPKTNPFELHINRQKNKVIGQKSKHDKGLPGISRAKAVNKRKDTLLQEYKKKYKANVMIDRRIGENDSNMTLEDKMTARFTAERQIAEEKRRGKNKFNLNDEEELTHYGQSLAEIEKFDDPRSEDDSEEEMAADEFLKQTSFGGLLKKKEENEESRKDKIDKIIALSKAKKLERHQDREEVLTLTDKLDQDWKNIRDLLSLKSKQSDPPPAPIEPDSYDILVRSLKFEARGKPSDRLKTEEELIAEEKEKLEKLEEDRLNRMKGGKETQIKSNHISADDLDDNFDLGRKRKTAKEIKLLCYKEGKLAMDDEDSEDDLEELKNDYTDSESDEESNDRSDVDSNNDDEISSNSESEEEDNFSDIESGDEELDNDEMDIVAETKIRGDEMASNDCETKVKEVNECDIPYVFNVPETMEEFNELVECYSSSQRRIVVDRIIKCNHPKLKAENKEKLDVFFSILLQYVDFLLTSGEIDFDTIDNLIPFLYDLTHMSPTNAANCFIEMLNTKRSNYSKKSIQYLSGVQSTLPKLDTLLLFHVISVLYPTSDFRHQVVTQALLFMGQILSECRPSSRQDVATGLALCSIILEYVTLSKRFVPEAVNYLSGVLSLAVNCTEHEKSLLILPPFKASMKNTLMLDSPVTSKHIALRPFKLHELTATEGFTDEFRINAVWLCCELLRSFADMYKELPSFQEIFLPVQVWVKKIALTHYPKEVQETIESLDVTLRTRHLLTPLMRTRKRPQSIKFFEPKIEADFTGRKSKKASHSDETQRLKHVVKRETKDALRELRRDNQFLAKHQLQEQMERDTERKRKVRELFNALCGQEGEYKTLMKAKKKKK